VVDTGGHGKRICHCNGVLIGTTYNFRIFIIEGAITVGVALLAYFVVPTWSHKAKFVSLHTHHIIPFDLMNNFAADRIRESEALPAPEYRL